MSGGEMYEFNQPLPKYKCHKVVGALRIKSITAKVAGRFHMLYVFTFEESEYDGFTLTEDWFKKHNPKTGGYLVQYDDSYLSFSPEKQFIEGYTKIETAESQSN